MSPIELFDLPQGSPSINPISGGQGYCSASTVASLNKARVIGVGQNPTLADVNNYIIMAAGQIDGVLLNKGYSVPINTASYPEVEGLLAWVNATGAAFMMEDAMPTNPAAADRAKAAWDAALKMLADAEWVLDVPTETARAEVRAPYISWQPPGTTFDPTYAGGNMNSGDGMSSSSTTNPRDPYFARGLQF
jgi:hypothetical protein